MFCQAGDRWQFQTERAQLSLVAVLQVGFFLVKIHLMFCPGVLFVREGIWNLAWVWKLFCSNSVRIMVGTQTSLLSSGTAPWIPLWRCLMVVPMTPMWPACDPWATCSMPLQGPVTRRCLAEHCWDTLGSSQVFCRVPPCNGALGSEQLLCPSLSCHLPPPFSLAFWHTWFYGSWS